MRQWAPHQARRRSCSIDDPGTTLNTAIYAQPGGELRWQLIGCAPRCPKGVGEVGGPWSGKQVSKLRLSLGGLRSTN